MTAGASPRPPAKRLDTWLAAAFAECVAGEGAYWVIDGDCPQCGERHLATNGRVTWCFSARCLPAPPGADAEGAG